MLHCHESFPPGPARTCELGATCGRCGGNRATPIAAPDLPAIDRVCDALLTGPGGLAVSALHKGNPTDTRNAIMRALRVMFPYVPDITLAERLAAAILSTSI